MLRSLGNWVCWLAWQCWTQYRTRVLDLKQTSRMDIGQGTSSACSRPAVCSYTVSSTVVLKAPYRPLLTQREVLAIVLEALCVLLSAYLSAVPATWPPTALLLPVQTLWPPPALTVNITNISNSNLCSCVWDTCLACLPSSLPHFFQVFAGMSPT